MPEPSAASTRVVLVDQYPDLWGAQAILLNTTAALVSAGVTVQILAPSGGTLEAAVTRRFGGRVAFVPLRAPTLRSGEKGVADVLRLLWSVFRFGRHLPLLRRAQIVHVFGPRLYPAVGIWSLFFRKSQSVFYHVHLDHRDGEKSLVRQLLRLPRTRGVLTVSRFIQGKLEDFHPVFARSGRLAFLENSLPEEEEPVFENRFRDRDVGDVMVLGRISPEKGQSILLDVAPSFPEWRFHVVGEAGAGSEDYADELREAAPPNLRFHGWQADVRDFIDREGIQLSIVPSVWDEPFGMVAIESMAASCLTLVSGRGGLAEISHRTGALTFKEAADLVDLLRNLDVSTREELAAVSRGQFDAVQTEYGFETYRKRLLDLYRLSPSESE